MKHDKSLPSREAFAFECIIEAPFETPSAAPADMATVEQRAAATVCHPHPVK
jgi:hypothetical protein